MMSLSEQRWTSANLALMFSAAAFRNDMGMWPVAALLAAVNALRWISLLWAGQEGGSR
jgi:hypothetical protein